MPLRRTAASLSAADYHQDETHLNNPIAMSLFFPSLTIASGSGMRAIRDLLGRASVPVVRKNTNV